MEDLEKEYKSEFQTLKKTHESELSTLKSRITDLETQNNQFQKDLDLKKKLSSDLKVKLKSQIEGLTDAKNLISKLNESNQSFMCKNKHLNDQINELNNQISIKESEIKKIECKFSKLQSNYQKFSDII